MRQIDQKSINILYDPIGQLTNRKNRLRFYAVLLASFAICPYKEKQTQPEFNRGMPQASHKIKVLLIELSRSVWENLDLGHVHRPHCVRSSCRYDHKDLLRLLG